LSGFVAEGNAMAVLLEPALRGPCDCVDGFVDGKLFYRAKSSYRLHFRTNAGSLDANTLHRNRSW